MRGEGSGGLGDCESSPSNLHAVSVATGRSDALAQKSGLEDPRNPGALV